MDMIEVRTSDLVGAALDWAVAHALGYSDGEDAFCNPAWRDGDRYVTSKHLFRPSTDWSQGGPLIEKLMRSGKWELVQWCGAVAFQNYNNECVPVDGESWDQESMIECGETPLIAACRAIVASKLGAAVQVPAHLVEGKA